MVRKLKTKPHSFLSRRRKVYFQSQSCRRCKIDECIEGELAELAL
jgi:hypothetical protein